MKAIDAQLIDVWEALEHNDKNEGRGGMSRIGIFRTEDGARGVAAGQGVFGGDGEIRHRVALVQLGTAYLLEPNPVDILDGKPDLIRQRALAKLTPEDRKALGV